MGEGRKKRSAPDLDEDVVDELWQAQNGRHAWVRPAVAAAALQCKVDTLKKWRQQDEKRKPGDEAKSPRWRPVENKRWTIEYEWASVVALAAKQEDLMGIAANDSARELASVKERVASLESLVTRLLAHLGDGAASLVKPTQWVVDDSKLIRGHEALVTKLGTWATVTKTWMEALDMPWDSQAMREPYQRAAMERLERIKEASKQGADPG